MKYIIPFVVASLLWGSVGYAVEYEKTLPTKPLIIWHSWIFSEKEIKEMVLERLRKDGVVLPTGKMKFMSISIRGGIQLIIEEPTTIIKLKEKQ